MELSLAQQKSKSKSEVNHWLNARKCKKCLQVITVRCAINMYLCDNAPNNVLLIFFMDNCLNTK